MASAPVKMTERRKPLRSRCIASPLHVLGIISGERLHNSTRRRAQLHNDEVSTESGSDRVSVAVRMGCGKAYPVATALGTDLTNTQTSALSKEKSLRASKSRSRPAT